MKRQSPGALGLVAAARLDPRGRASLWACAGGPGRELWRLPAEDEAVGRRLLALGKAGVGGFGEGGADEEGVWLLRSLPGAPLAERLRERKGPWPWAQAVAIARGIAGALAACEKGSLFPGAVGPDAVYVEEGGVVTLPAFALVGALVGAKEGGVRGGSEPSPLWTPPAQADGALWDGAANRYGLGLVLYRLLAGEHPFAGAGLRHALGEAAHREAPPFVDAVAKALPAGLQSLTLRLLDPQPARRPGKAGEIVEELERFQEQQPTKQPDMDVVRVPRLPVAMSPPRTPLSPGPFPPVSGERGGERPSRGIAGSPPFPPKPGERAGDRGVRDSNAATSWPARLWPLLAGVIVALGSLLLLSPAPAKPRPLTVPPQRPLTSAQTSAQDCASCHPRQAAEWRRSVMAHSVKSPLFNALESLIEEQVGRDDACPGGAGILRRADPTRVCRDEKSGLAVTGSGGEHWCVNCHSPTEKLDGPLPPWDGRAGGDARSRRPVRDLLAESALSGISCAFCHEVHGPVGGRGARGYQGNPSWTSFVTGATFGARPEDARGLFGIGNSGYDVHTDDFLGAGDALPAAGTFASVVLTAHRRPPASARTYLKSSEFCGACHDVRLFGTDTLGGPKGEPFKRLRNAYSEWAAYAKGEARAGRTAPGCQECHMSSYPGVCEPGAGATDPECPAGTHFVARAPGAFPQGRVADNSPELTAVVNHTFSGVDVPLSREFPDELVDEATVDFHGLPMGARRRRDLLLRHTFRFGLGAARRSGDRMEIPLAIENTGAGHRVPAGFSQEREFWVHLTVRDGTGRLLYEVGRVDRGDEDLHDKVFVRVNTQVDALDARGRPEGLFGADVRDGVDVPAWSPPPALGGTSFRGRGLINFQNGFLRCVRCIGIIAPDGRCEAGPGQGDLRADRFADGDYDLDTGECRSNLTGLNALFETYFPVGALDASRGLPKGPDAIIDTRSVPPGVPIRYTYDLATEGRRGPFRVEARLLFRAFPPFLVRGFAAYEREQARRGLRPSGPLVTDDMLGRLEVVEIARDTAEIP